MIGWHFLLDHVPTHHLEPLYRHVKNTKRDPYPMKVDRLLVAWNDRYEEEPGPPPPGHSYFRDDRGRYLPAGRDPETGRFPGGHADWREAAEAEQRKAAEWAAEHGPAQLPEGGRGGA